MFTILTCDPLFYISPPTSQALRLDAGCHQMLLPAMQLVRNLNTFCCVVDRNHPQSHVGAFIAGISFPQIQFPGTVAEICCSFRGFLIFVSLQTPSPHIITTLNNFHPFSASPKVLGSTRTSCTSTMVQRRCPKVSVLHLVWPPRCCGTRPKNLSAATLQMPHQRLVVTWLLFSSEFTVASHIPAPVLT